MKGKSVIIKVIILAAVLVFLLNPSLNPFLGAESKATVSAQLQETFGVLAGGTAGVFSAPKIITLLALIAAVWLIFTVVNYALTKISSFRKRESSVITLVISLVKYAAVLVAVIWGLSILGVNVGAIFASIGVLSLIVGFGAQSLIEDTITGIFIIFERNFEVGDYIVLDDFRGRVRKIGIRTICIEDDGGNLKIVNNSDIRNFQNRSEKLSLAVCDVGVSYDADLRQVEKELLDSLEEIYARNTDVFEEVPVYKGVEGLDASAVTLRFTVQAKEENVFAARRRLNRELKLVMDEKNIEIPFAQLVVHQGK